MAVSLSCITPHGVQRGAEFHRRDEPQGCEGLFRLGPHPLGPGFEDESVGGAGAGGAKHKASKGVRRSKAAGVHAGGGRVREEREAVDEDFLQDW